MSLLSLETEKEKDASCRWLETNLSARGFRISVFKDERTPEDVDISESNIEENDSKLEALPPASKVYRKPLMPPSYRKFKKFPVSPHSTNTSV